MNIRTSTTGDLQVFLQSVPTSLTTTVSATRTLTSGDSGKVFAVTTGTYTVTLPTPAPGLRFGFVITTDSAGVVGFTCGTAALHGVVSINDVNTQVNNRTTINFAAAAVVGDFLSFTGLSATEYLVAGATTGVAGITMA